MKNLIFLLLTISITFFACSQNSEKKGTPTTSDTIKSVVQDTIIEVSKEPEFLLDTIGTTTIKTRILVPKGYKRINVDSNSFAHYLRNLPLKPHGAIVLSYNGYEKLNDNIYIAVVNMRIGDKNLHQCADAVMHLRADYLFKQKQYNKIHFNFTNGQRIDYSKWMEGNRIRLNGNKSYWVKVANPSNTSEDLWKYLTLVFNYAGSYSLSKELVHVEINDMQIGDVFIQQGSPYGHAVIVVDMAENPNTGEKIFMVAQSFMPAQSIHILKNTNKNDSPWYPLNFGEKLRLPSWTFNKNDLRRF